jgi:hypothetical protein
MVTADSTATIANIWERLVDHHQAEVSYATCAARSWPMSACCCGLA